MKRDLEMSVNLESREFDTLRSISMNDLYIHLDLWVSEGKYESKGLNWEEWDALVAEVERYRKLKAMSDAA